MKHLVTALLVNAFFQMNAQDYLITDYGAVPDDNSLNTQAIQSTIDKANR